MSLIIFIIGLPIFIIGFTGAFLKFWFKWGWLTGASIIQLIDMD